MKKNNDKVKKSFFLYVTISFSTNVCLVMVLICIGMPLTCGYGGTDRP